MQSDEPRDRFTEKFMVRTREQVNDATEDTQVGVSETSSEPYIRCQLHKRPLEGERHKAYSTLASYDGELHLAGQPIKQKYVQQYSA
jgi:hypothetical protein